MNGLQVSLLRDLGAAMRLGADWDGLAARSGADIYFDRVWVETWWRHFGTGRRVLAICVHEDGRLVGLLPFAVETLWPGGVPVRLARLAGPNPNYAILRLPLEAGREEAVLGAALTALVGTACDVVSLSPLSGGSPHWPAVRAAVGEAGLAHHPGGAIREHMQIPLAPSFEAYMARLSRNRRSKHRRSKRLVEEERGIVTEVVAGTDAAAFLPDFVALHDTQFKTRNRLGHFDDWPGSRAFYADFCRATAATGQARFYVQRDPEGRVKAALFCFVTDRACHAHLTARDEDPDLASADFGLYAQFERIERLIAEGVEVVESGAGDYDYKRSLDGETLPMLRVLIGGASAAARWRLALLARWADAVDLVYYRGWFLKVAPRLRPYGLARAPLWRGWIRSRF